MLNNNLEGGGLIKEMGFKVIDGGGEFNVAFTGLEK